MEITRTELRINRVRSTLARGTVEFNGALVVNFSLVKGDKGPFVKLGDSQQGADGKWYSSAYMTSDDLRKKVTETVIQKYNEVLSQSRLEPAQQEENAAS